MTHMAFRLPYITSVEGDSITIDSNYMHILAILKMSCPEVPEPMEKQFFFFFSHFVTVCSGYVTIDQKYALEVKAIAEMPTIAHWVGSL